MSAHTLIRIEREAGVSEARYHAVCSCLWIGPDHGARPLDPESRLRADALARRDHQLHAEGKPIGQAEDERDLPGKPYSPPDGG